MKLLVSGLVLFLGIHSIRMLAPGWRERCVARIGLLPWKGLYSVLSLLGLALIVVGFGQARQTPLAAWLLPAGLRHLNALFTLAAFVLIAAAYVPRNHFRTWLGHPMLAGVALWALGHLLATRFLHDVLLFGTFLVWALACFIGSRRRDRGMARPAASLGGDAATLVLGIAGWAVFAFLLHLPLIGVSPGF